jgi:hypothetical protein
MARGGSAGEPKAGPPHLARAAFGAILGMGSPWLLSAKAAADADMFRRLVLTQTGRRGSFCSDPEFLDDWPPFVDIGLHERA